MSIALERRDAIELNEPSTEVGSPTGLKGVIAGGELTGDGVFLGVSLLFPIILSIENVFDADEVTDDDVDTGGDDTFLGTAGDTLTRDAGECWSAGFSTGER